MTRTLRIAAVHLALVAMMLRALLPAGWMPSVTAGAPITICTMDGMVRIAPGADSPSHKQHQQDDGRSHEICPFGAAPHFAAPVQLAVLAAPSTLSFILAPKAPVAVPSGRDGYAPQSSRGPPRFA